MAVDKDPNAIRLQRVSNRNIERVEKLGKMCTGDSFNDVLTRALDGCEKKGKTKGEK